ncbi:MAG: hypothetical protein K6C31_06645 [Bacteroidales bacterium]|nr:hypothetical protein [Bacteroidales bacterium]
MLYFLLTLMAIGAVLGLVFAKNGEESEAAWRGAKSGLKIGCGCLIILILLFFLFAILIFGGSLSGLGVSPADLPSPDTILHNI